VSTVFTWQFRNLHELSAALQQYLDFLDGTIVTHYGLSHGARDTDPVLVMHICQRRSEIDACMDALQNISPLLWRVLDIHYRRGASLELRGWAITAGCLGLRRASCPPGVRCVLRDAQGESRLDLPACADSEYLGCELDHENLQHCLGMATRKLYQIHQARHGEGEGRPTECLTNCSKVV